jgi:hypothetical protein
MPFAGVSLFHLLGLISVARSGARGVLQQEGSMTVQYQVFTGDNFQMYDEDETYDSKVCSSQEEAITAAKSIIIKSLRWEREQSRNPQDPDELYARYTSFGDTPVIQPATEPPFSAWDFAKLQCQEICQEPLLRERPWTPSKPS